MALLQKQYEDVKGRATVDNRSKYILMTMRQSFKPHEVDAQTAHTLACQLAEEFLEQYGNKNNNGSPVKYQYVVATHVNSHCIHNHITFNIIGDDLTRFRQNKFTPKRLAEVSDKLCEEYGLSIVTPNRNRDRRHKYTWINPTSYRTYIKNDIDRCIEKAKDYNEFLALMGEDYFCKASGKYLAFRHRTNGQKRNIRTYTLGDAYRESAIRQRIATGVYISVPEEEQSLSYSQKLHQIESMFRTKGVLRENNIQNYEDFTAIITRIAGQSAELQTTMRELENRIDDLQAVTDSFDAIQKYQPIMDGLDAVLLKDRYRLQNHEGINAYQSAAAVLSERGLSPKDTAAKEQYQNLYSSASAKLEKLWRQYDGLQADLEKISEAKRTMERVYAEAPTKKGDAYHDWGKRSR